MIVGMHLRGDQNVEIGPSDDRHFAGIERQVTKNVVLAAAGHSVSLLNLRLHPSSFFIRGCYLLFRGENVEVWLSSKIDEGVGIYSD